MNKAELINAAAEKAGLSKKDTEAAVDAAIKAITEALASWLALAPSRSVPVPPASAATPRPRRRSRSPLPRSPLSSPARP